MRNLILALLLVLPAPAAVTFVQTRAGGNDSVTSVATAAASPAFAAGEVVLVGVGFRDACSVATVTVDDNKSGGSNTYTQVGTSLDNAGITCLSVFRSTIAGAATVITAHFSASVRFCGIVALHFNGFTGTPTLDQVKTATGINSIATTAALTTTMANEAVAAFFKTESAESGTFPAPTGFGTFTSVAADPYQNSTGAAYQVLGSIQSNVTVTEDAVQNSNIEMIVVTMGDSAGEPPPATTYPRKRRVIL